MKKAARLLGSAALLGVLAWRVDFARIGATLRGVHWGLWLAAVLCYGFAQLVSARRWQALARPLGFDNRLWEFAGFYFIGTFFNLLLPTSVGGDVVRSCYLDGRSGRGWSAFLTVLAERLSGVVVLLAMAAASALLLREPGWVGWWAAGAGALAAAVLLAFLFAPRQLPPRWRFGPLTKLLAVAGAYRSSPRLLARVGVLSAVVQAANMVMVWLLARALGLPLPLLLFFALVPLVSLLTLAPVSLNGMGVREGALVVLLAPLGVAAEGAVALGLLWLSVLVAAGLAGAGFHLFGRFPRNEVRSDGEPVGGHPDQGRARQSRPAA